jgi:hypothetical protein
MIKKAFIAPVVILLLSAPAAHGQGQNEEGRGKGERFRNQTMALLTVAGLDQNQWAQVRRLFDSTRAATRPLRGQMGALRQQLIDKLAGTAPVRLNDLDEIRQQMRTIQQKVDDQVLGMVLQIRGILTAQQLQLVADTYGKLKSLRSQINALVKTADDDSTARTSSSRWY